MFRSWQRMMRNTIIKRNSCSLADYETTLTVLHNLQSNAEYLKLSAETKDKPRKLEDVQKYLLRTGITVEKLDTLSVIHVAGTKGKGSSCAYTEAILREHGYTTGFYSSPHLVTVRERIKINGQSISESLFIKYFWEVHRKLENTKEHESDMPMYFKFLTVLMFKIFLELNVDVAIIEVGIGGLYDCTNIVRNPVCIGITSLALDHTCLLGSTVEDIAYQKSGIFKDGSVAFSVPQDPRAMGVLEKRAVERNCRLHVIPPFEEYKWDNISPILEIRNKVQEENASLAIQMANAWIKSKNKHLSAMPTTVDINKNTIQHMDKIAMGLSSCKWPGRMQILRSSIGDFLLDGAHTIESMRSCVWWFNDFVAKKGGGKNILIFNTSFKRDPTTLLTPLKSIQFEKTYFVPNYAGVDSVDDEFNHYHLHTQKLQVSNNAKFWGADSVIANSVSEVLQDIKKANCNNNETCNVLVTGSLHLVGAALAVLDPHLTMSTQF